MKSVALGWALYLFAAAGCHTAPSPERAGATPEECRLTIPVQTEHERRSIAAMSASCQPQDRCLLACWWADCGKGPAGDCSRQCLHSTATDDDAALVERAAAFLEARRSGICR